jgi:hypothetical protein
VEAGPERAPPVAHGGGGAELQSKLVGPAVAAIKRGADDSLGVGEVLGRARDAREVSVWLGGRETAAATPTAATADATATAIVASGLIWPRRACTSTRERPRAGHKALHGQVACCMHACALRHAAPRRVAGWASGQATEAHLGAQGLKRGAEGPQPMWSTAVASKRPYAGETRGRRVARGRHRTRPARECGDVGWLGLLNSIYPVPKTLNSKKCQLS